MVPRRPDRPTEKARLANGKPASSFTFAHRVLPLRGLRPSRPRAVAAARFGRAREAICPAGVGAPARGPNPAPTGQSCTGHGGDRWLLRGGGLGKHGAVAAQLRQFSRPIKIIGYHRNCVHRPVLGLALASACTPERPVSSCKAKQSQPEAPGLLVAYELTWVLPLGPARRVVEAPRCRIRKGASKAAVLS